MGDMHDAWFFIGIFVFIFIIWIAVGGPTHPLAFTGLALSQPSPLGNGTYLQLPKAPFSIGGATVSLPGSSNGNSSGNSASAPSLGNGNFFGSPSIYRGIVSLDHYVSGAGSSNLENEYIELSVAQNAGVPVDLSGWTLSSDATGNAAIIPKGTEIPTSGIVNAAQDIVLTPGERAIIISGQSPIGASFRENKCIGYFGNFQTFSPPLPQNCPEPSDELSSFYGAGYIRDDACIEYVKTLSRCQIALTPPIGASSACQGFLEKYMNYNGCVTAHQNDADFEGDTWRIYLGRSDSMWRTRNELVKLLDAKGDTVDAFSY
ncbi:MAG: hypothetical protein ABSB00_03235 [Minisyncoccia bacterium]|jgi:hypothetical protein